MPRRGRCDKGQEVITELEFKSLAAQGFNRIPLLQEAFADLETPLSLYLKLAGGRKHSFLLESVVGGERFGRYSFIGLPAKTLLRASGLRTEVVTDGVVVETHEGNPLDFIASYQARFKVALRPGLPRFCGGLAGYFGYDAVRYIEPKLANTWKPGGIDTPDILLLQTEELAVIDNLSGRLYLIVYADPRAPEAYFNAQEAAVGAGRQAALQRDRAAREARPQPCGGARVREGRLPGRGGDEQGVHRRRRHDAGADRPAPEEALHREPAEPVPRAALAEPVAVHVLLRHGRLPDRRRQPRDPGAPGAHARRRQGDDPPAGRHAPARRHARAGQGAGSRAVGRPEGARRAPDADRPGAQRHRPHREDRQRQGDRGLRRSSATRT